MFHQLGLLAERLVTYKFNTQKKKKLPAKFSSFLFSFLGSRPIGPLLLIFFVLCWAINEALFPYFIKELIDLAVTHSPTLNLWEVLAPTVLTMMCVWILMETSMRFFGIVCHLYFPILRSEIRLSLFKHIRKHSHQYFVDQFPGKLASKINDLPKGIEDFLIIFIFNIIGINFSFFLSLYLLWKVNSIFGLILLGFYACILAFSLYFSPKINKRASKHADAISVLNGQIVDVFNNILAVHLFARGQYEQKRLTKYQNKEIEVSRNSTKLIEFSHFVRGILILILMILVMTFLIQGLKNGTVSAGEFSLVSFGVFNLIGLLWHMSMQMTDLYRHVGTAEAALDLIRTPYNVTEKENAHGLYTTYGEIHFKQMTFSHRKDLKLFENLNLTIDAGQKVGLVGFSGAGKTTLVHLLLRFSDPQSGKIMIDNHDIKELTLNSLRNLVAHIPQDTYLFHRSLMENIRYGRLDATDDEVIEASRKAQCLDFINKLPQKFETEVGERGVKLSGGQRQRIAIARAFLKNAPILVLDEATSALDSETEHCIQKALKGLMKGRTTIVVAHRLSTLRDMDRILVFDQGKLVEDASQNDLLKKDGLFAKLWKMQSYGLLPINDTTV